MLEILYQDLSFIAVNKPSGLLVHRSKIDRHETAFALQQVRDQIGQRVYPFHRLDKPTSGVLLFALNPDAARLMTEMFTSGKPHKRYLAVVRGYTKRDDVIDYPLNEELDKMTDQRASQNKAAQTAVTHYRCVATVELPHAVGRYQSARYSLIEVTPETGRKHQIRRHMKHIFHPIIGDTTHGDGKHNQLFRNRYGCHRLLLHAAELRFTHPINGERVSIEAPLDDTFSQVAKLFQLSKASRG
ncbi:MAG TPA: tRNA pseudouridine(65) synthase TruC [Chromatiales bacterium]|nr:tRNA pseudouridine(65) synthase TruC [Chromatiales bacterium]